MSSIEIRYVAPRTLDAGARQEIWEFFSRYVRRDQGAFEAKLASSEEVFLGRTNGKLAAFGAVDTLTSTYGGRAHGIILTHWAALDPSVRGNNVIQRVGLRYFVRFRARHPRTPAYWMFGASTFKSYLLLPRNCAEFWPRRGHEWPARERALVRDVMERSNDSGWDPERGTIRRFGVSRYVEGVVDDAPEVLRDPDVRYYRALNPGQRDGDTLVCLCPLHLTQWASIARASFRRARR
jgi:hypothetical protein